MRKTTKGRNSLVNRKARILLGLGINSAGLLVLANGALGLL